MHAQRRGFICCPILGLCLIATGCGPEGTIGRHRPPSTSLTRPTKQSPVPAPPLPAITHPVTPPVTRPVTPPAAPAPAACAALPAGRSAAGRLSGQWNRFHRWLAGRGYHRRSYANSRQFTTRVGDAIAARLRRNHRSHRVRAARLAIMLLGLRARTVRGNGSTWDCTTRMLQLAAQARKLASMRGISYTGYRRGRLQTISGPRAYRGYHVSRQIVTLMAVAHYKEPRLARRNMAWRTPLLGAGEIWKKRHYARLRVGDILWYPTYGPGHFGTVLYRSQNFFVVVEGYWRGQSTVIHIYKRHDRITDRCIRRELARLRGFSDLSTTTTTTTTTTAATATTTPWAKNVLSGLIDDKGPLRIGRHR